MRRRVFLALVAGGLGACGGNDTIEPPADLARFEPRLEIREIWRQKVGKGSERLRLGLAPESDGNHVFVGSHDGTASALGLEDGEALWSVDTGQALAAGPGIGGGVVVFGTSEGSIIALDAATGAELWVRSVGSEVLAPPVVGNETIVFRTVDGRLNAVSIDDGEDLWTVVQTLPPLTLRGNSAPILIGDVAIAGFDNGRVGAYDIDNGISRWELPLASPTGRSEIDRLVDVGMDLEVFGNDVYAATFQGRAAAIDLGEGVVIWQQDLSSFTGIGVDIQHVYVTDDVSTVYALNRLDGIEAWRQEGLRLRDVTAATRFRETVVVADYQGYVHWLDGADGSFLARERAASSAIVAQPLAIGPTVYVQSEDGTVAAFQIVGRAG